MLRIPEDALHAAWARRSAASFVLRAAWAAGVVALLVGGGAAPAARAQASGPYVVKEGDTLYRIAQTHDLTVARLRSLNELEGNAIYPGQTLRVRPPQDEAATAPGEATPPPPAQQQEATPSSGTPTRSVEPLYGSHTVEATGSTLYTLAARYGTSVDSLLALNDSLLASAGTGLRRGDRVRLPPSLGPPTHTVAEGETIYDVARQYNVSAKLLQHTNGLAEKAVRPGQRLCLPGREAPAPQPRGTPRPARERGPVARYPASYEGRLMAGSDRYDPEQYVVSHPSLPIGTVVLLTNPEAGRQAFAQVADRGPLDEAFVMDVSAAVYEHLGLGENGPPVVVRVMD